MVQAYVLLLVGKYECAVLLIVVAAHHDISEEAEWTDIAVYDCDSVALA